MQCPVTNVVGLRKEAGRARRRVIMIKFCDESNDLTRNGYCRFEQVRLLFAPVVTQ